MLEPYPEVDARRIDQALEAAFSDNGADKADAILLAGQSFEALVYVAGSVDIAFLKTKFTRESEKDARYVASVEAKLANEQFIAKAPAALVEEERKKVNIARAHVEKLRVWLRDL
jgi:valyl-tRNA synthetase